MTETNELHINNSKEMEQLYANIKSILAMARQRAYYAMM